MSDTDPVAQPVAAIAANGPSTPSVRVRLLGPAAALRAQGVRLEALTLLDDEAERRFRAGGAGAKLRQVAAGRRRLRRRIGALEPGSSVIVQRQADLTPSLGLERAAARGRRLLYDVDDAIWLDAGLAPGRHRLAALKGTPRKLRWLAGRADAVIAGNELLAEHLARYSDRVTVVPSLVDPDAVPPRRHAEAEEVVLGWIGSPVNTAYLQQLLDALAASPPPPGGPRLRLLAVGSGPLRPGALRVERRAWSEAAEREALGRIDIGLSPLPDDAWARGKCAYKALLYMSAGIPVLADDVGITAAAVGDGEGGLVVPAGGDRGAAWRERLGALAADAALRARLGAAARERVERGYSVRAWAPQLARIIRPR